MARNALNCNPRVTTWQAQSFLNVGGQSAGAEFAKIARGGLGRSLAVGADKRYAPVFDAIATSSKRPPVSTLSEARLVLRKAAVRRDDAGAPQRVRESLEFLPTAPAAERLPTPRSQAADGRSEGEGASGVEVRARRLLQGEWLLGLTVREKAISFAPYEATQQLRLADGTYERLAPSGMGLVKTAGSLELRVGVTSVRPSESAAAAPELELTFGVDSCTLGPFPVPQLGNGASGAERIILLDSLMCITQQNGGSTAVWVRPSMRRAEDDDDDYI